MKSDIPRGKVSRTISSGKIAAQIGTNQLGYIIKRPFLTKDKQKQSKDKLDEKNAQILFNGLSLLRGTALKAAQMLSFESDIIPKAVRKELEKSYNQVPPINRALVRKIIINNFREPPESVFSSFDSQAFAAASLGQVHLARSKKGQKLAVKIQYPDIAKTISNDIRILKTALRPMSQYGIIKTALDEIETVLLDETDYEKEADNIRFFNDNLNEARVDIPELNSDLSTKQVLSMSLMEGQILNQWLETNPNQESKNYVAQVLHDVFIRGFYELKFIHADPHPGNFLITDDLRITFLDFGCVRRFDDNLINLYQRLINKAGSQNKKEYLKISKEMWLLPDDLDKEIEDLIADLFMQISNWISQLFAEDEFDFSKHPDFMEQGREIGQKGHEIRKHITTIIPEFIFLQRTRYGLFRLFEKMKVKIRFRNKYEYC